MHNCGDCIIYYDAMFWRFNTCKRRQGSEFYFTFLSCEVMARAKKTRGGGGRRGARGGTTARGRGGRAVDSDDKVVWPRRTRARAAAEVEVEENLPMVEEESVDIGEEAILPQPRVPQQALPQSGDAMDVAIEAAFHRYSRTPRGEGG